MATFQWVKGGLDRIDDTADMHDVLTAAGVKAGLIGTSPLTYSFTTEYADLTIVTGSGYAPQDIHTLWDRAWHDYDRGCVYRKAPAVTFLNGGDPLTVTGLAVFDSTDGNFLLGMIVFDDEEVLNVNDGIEIDIFAGITSCNPDAIVTVLEF